MGRPPSQPGTRRGVQPTGRLPSRQNSMGGGTSASRWATATSASQDRKVSNPAKPPPPSSSRPATQKDVPPHVIAQSTPLPPKPQAQAPPRAPTPEIVPEKVASPSPSPPRIEPSTPDSFSQSVVPPDFSQPSIATTSTPPSAPATVAVESKPSSPSPSPNPRSPSPVSVPTPRAPSPALSPPIPVVESPALPVEATPEKEEKEVLAQFEKPVESENSEKVRALSTPDSLLTLMTLTRGTLTRVLSLPFRKSFDLGTTGIPFLFYQNLETRLSYAPRTALTAFFTQTICCFESVTTSFALVTR